MGRLLVRGGCVLTLGPKSQNHRVADVLVDDGLVVEVGPDLRARDAEVIDARDTIVMPGFVDTHRHTAMALFRNLGSAVRDIDTAHFQPDDVYAGTLIGLLSAIESGTTTVVDWSGADDPARTEATLQAHSDAGLRTVLAHPAVTRGSELGGGSVGPDTTTAFASVDVTRDHVPEIERQWPAARSAGLRIHAHAGLERSDAGVVAGLAERGLLDSDVTLVHCSHLDDADLDAIGASGAAVAVAPSSEMAAGLGAPPLQKFLDRRIIPGLAIDDERIAPGDMLAQMRAANSVQHAAYFDLKLAGKAGLPNLLTTRDMIRYATHEGARAIGLGDVTGSLEPGKRADLIVLRTDRPNIFPINDPIGAVVWGVDSSNLDWVIVGGRTLMREGELDADLGRARDLAVAARDRVMAAAGVIAPTDVMAPTGTPESV